MAFEGNGDHHFSPQHNIISPREALPVYSRNPYRRLPSTDETGGTGQSYFTSYSDAPRASSDPSAPGLNNNEGTPSDSSANTDGPLSRVPGSISSTLSRIIHRRQKDSIPENSMVDDGRGIEFQPLNSNPQSPEMMRDYPSQPNDTPTTFVEENNGRG